MQPTSIIYFHSEKDPVYGYLSNWFPSGFTGTRGGESYISVEQYMMQKKAICMNDDESEKKIMSFTNDGFLNSASQLNWTLIHNKMKEIKAIGRQVQNWDQKIWDEYKFQIVKQGLMYKFCQQPQLLQLLLSTGNAYLAEASSQDRIWGIGFDSSSAKSAGSEAWGQNLLGKGLMEVRSILSRSIPDWGHVVNVQPMKSLRRDDVKEIQDDVEVIVENESEEDDESTVEDLTLKPEEIPIDVDAAVEEIEAEEAEKEDSECIAVTLMITPSSQPITEDKVEEKKEANSLTDLLESSNDPVDEEAASLSGLLSELDAN